MGRLISVNQLHCYPVKSLGGMALRSATIEPRGLRYDRRWLVVDREGRFLTQRELPRMACIVPVIASAYLTLHAPDMPPLSIPLTLDNTSPRIDIRVWRSVCQAQPVSAECDHWLTRYLNTPCRLVYMPDDTRRPVNPDYAAGEGIVSFADGYPLMLLSEASLAELNTHLDIAVPMNRFRPNIVVTGIEPYGEDNWKQVRIGDVMFHVVKPCDRCVMTTIDQQAGQRAGQEPLRTLSRLRLRDGKALFGQYLIPEKAGELSVGDEVTVVLAAP